MNWRSLVASTVVAASALGLQPSVASAKPSPITLGDWWVVDSPGSRIGAGPNYWSASNVWVDQAGLHLKITGVGGTWYCAEVISKASFGYGTYAWSVSSPINNLDPNVVLGLFTWNDAPPYHHREIDFEASRWGDAKDPTNAQFVVQPWSRRGNLKRITATGGPSAISFTWKPGSVSFRHNQQTWIYTGRSVPRPSTGVQMNLWLMNGQAPTDNQAAEVIIGDFTYTR